MANTFASVPLADPRRITLARDRFNRDVIRQIESANCLYVSSGRLPARGWLLVPRYFLNQVSLYAANLSLSINDYGATGVQLTLNGLSIVHSRCVTRGIATDAGAIYLVEVTDARGLLKNRWFQAPTTSVYNVRAPAYPQQFYTPSLNAGTPWTWATMVGDLWSQCAVLGAFPGLPVTPTGTPENFWFPGTPLWDALNDVLDLIGCTIAVDLTSATPYTIVQDGAADAAYAALQAKYAPILQDDLEWIDSGAARAPKQVTVYFHRRNQQYGTEETVRMDSLQWSMTPLYSFTVPAPAQFAAATGTHFIWDDFTVQFDVNNQPLPADVATANAIATERVAEYYGRIYRATVGFVSRQYAGALPFRTGSQVDGVAWRQARDREGWTTLVMLGETWPQVIDQ